MYRCEPCPNHTRIFNSACNEYSKTAFLYIDSCFVDKNRIRYAREPLKAQVVIQKVFRSDSPSGENQTSGIIAEGIIRSDINKSTIV